MRCEFQVRCNGGSRPTLLTSDAPYCRRRPEGERSCSSEQHRASHTTHQHGYALLGLFEVNLRSAKGAHELNSGRARGQSSFLTLPKAEEKTNNPHPLSSGRMRHVSNTAYFLALCCCCRMAGGFVATAGVGSGSVNSKMSAGRGHTGLAMVS